MIAKDILTTNYAKIDKNAAISELIGELIRTKQKAAIVIFLLIQIQLVLSRGQKENIPVGG